MKVSNNTLNRQITSANSKRTNKLAVTLAKMPYNAVVSGFLILGEGVNIATLNYGLKYNQVSDESRYEQLLAAFSKLISSIFISYIPAIFLEMSIKDRITKKVAPKYMHTKHKLYPSFERILALIATFIITLPINEIIRPIVVSFLTSLGIKNREQVPNWILKVFDLKTNNKQA